MLYYIVNIGLVVCCVLGLVYFSGINFALSKKSEFEFGDFISAIDKIEHDFRTNALHRFYHASYQFSTTVISVAAIWYATSTGKVGNIISYVTIAIWVLGLVTMVRVKNLVETEGQSYKSNEEHW